MDPVSLVVGALAVGTAAGVSDTAKAAVGDLYARVKARLAGKDPSTDPAVLAEELAAVGVDAETVVLAERVMALVDGSITIVGAQGVQIGDHNSQTNNFG